MSRILDVAVGGAAGAVARHLILLTVGSGAGLLGLSPSHYVLVLINAGGSLVIGGLWALRGDTNHPAWFLVGVGLCGGFTSFSTFAVDTAQLLDSGDLGPAAVLVSVTVMACYAAVTAGNALVERRRAWN